MTLVAQEWASFRDIRVGMDSPPFLRFSDAEGFCLLGYFDYAPDDHGRSWVEVLIEGVDAESLAVACQLWRVNLSLIRRRL